VNINGVRQKRGGISIDDKILPAAEIGKIHAQQRDFWRRSCCLKMTA